MENQMTKQNDKVREWTDFACSDGNCIFKDLTKPGGMQTNGGCKCLYDLNPEKRLGVRRLKSAHFKLQEELAEKQKLLDECETYLNAVKDAYFWLAPGEKRNLTYNSKATELLTKLRERKGDGKV